MISQSNFYYKAIVRSNSKTKIVCQKLQPGEIALISHQDLDETAAKDLLAKNVKVVINTKSFFSGSYPHRGPLLLLKKGVFLLENIGGDILDVVKNDILLEVCGNKIIQNNKIIAEGTILHKAQFEKKYILSQNKVEKQLDKFVQNTLQYARRETGLILGKIGLPAVRTAFQGKHVVVVTRGKDYREDFEAIIPYIRETRPVLMGVDGGGDLILKKGFIPDIIIGDMDSVTDLALKKAKEVVLHAYPDGRAPGRDRLIKLGIPYVLFPAPGISEDIALLLAYEKQAKLIVAVGTHSHMIDFLEKGRQGMGSTFLVRLKVGSRLVDAKGVNQLYRSSIRWTVITALILSAMLPLAIIIVMSPVLQHFLKLIWLRLKYGFF